MDVRHRQRRLHDPRQRGYVGQLLQRAVLLDRRNQLAVGEQPGRNPHPGPSRGRDLPQLFIDGLDRQLRHQTSRTTVALYPSPTATNESRWYVTALTSGGGRPTRPLTVASAEVGPSSSVSSAMGSNPSLSARNTSSSIHAARRAGRYSASTEAYRRTPRARSVP